MTPTGKTPAQAEKEKLQREWEAAVKATLDTVISTIPNLDPKDIDTRASVYREMLAIKEKVAQCSPAVRKSYNKAVNVLFGDMDAIPGSMYLPEEDPKP